MDAPTPIGYTWKVFTEQGWGLTCSQGDRSTSHFQNSHSLVQSLQTSCQDILLGLPGFLGPDSEYSYSFVFIFLLDGGQSLSMHLNSLIKCFELLRSFPKAPLPTMWLPPCDRPPFSPEWLQDLQLACPGVFFWNFNSQASVWALFFPSSFRFCLSFNSFINETKRLKKLPGFPQYHMIASQTCHNFQCGKQTILAQYYHEMLKVHQSQMSRRH